MMRCNDEECDGYMKKLDAQGICTFAPTYGKCDHCVELIQGYKLQEGVGRHAEDWTEHYNYDRISGITPIQQKVDGMVFRNIRGTDQTDLKEAQFFIQKQVHDLFYEMWLEGVNCEAWEPSPTYLDCECDA